MIEREPITHVLSLPTLSRSSSASDAAEHSTLIDLRKLDR